MARREVAVEVESDLADRSHGGCPRQLLDAVERALGHLRRLVRVEPDRREQPRVLRPRREGDGRLARRNILSAHENGLDARRRGAREDRLAVLVEARTLQMAVGVEEAHQVATGSGISSLR